MQIRKVITLDDILYLDELSPLVEERAVEKREIVARIVPYDTPILVRGKPESFARGSLADINPADVRLHVMHDYNQKALPVGKMISLEERDDGAYAVFKVAQTTKGDEVLQLVAEGILSDVSVGFVPEVRTSEGVIRKVKAMPEVSLVPKGAYPGATVLAVRSDHSDEKEGNMPENIETTEAVNEQPESGNEALEQRMKAFEDELAKLRTISVAPAPQKATVKDLPTAEQFYKAKIAALLGFGSEKLDRMYEVFDNLEERVIADLTGTFGGSSDMSDFVVEEYMASQLVNVLNTRRPVFRNVGDFAAPRSGAMRVPKITQHTQVAKRTTQHSEPASRAIVADSEQYEADWFSGAVDIALELIRTSEIDAVNFVYENMLGQYAVATEADLIAQIEGTAGLTYEGSLATDKYENFAADVAEAALTVWQATDVPATKLAVPYTTWPTIISFVDANDRRQFTAGDHSDANVGFTSFSFTLPGGILVYAAGVSKPLLYNEEALKAHDYGVERVEATSVGTMAISLGILGRTLYFPRIPSGIVVFDNAPTSS